MFKGVIDSESCVFHLPRRMDGLGHIPAANLRILTSILIACSKFLSVDQKI